MQNDVKIPIDIISHKEIQQSTVPYSDKIDSRTFSILLDGDKVAASYKMYWLLGILDEASIGNEEIEFNKIIARMITYAWYPIRRYKLSFGRFDNLKNPINYAAEKYKFRNNCSQKELLNFLYTSDDAELKAMMKELTNNVPYRLISPFFKNDLRGIKDSSKNKMITYLSQNNGSCIYKIIKGEKDKIVLNDVWADYLRSNYRLIKSWINFKLVCFIQKRNSNVPAVAFKLEAQNNRKLSSAVKLWNKIIDSSNITDIYTGKDFSSENYKEYGVLSIDYFIPWSFVMHDEIWNLVPTFKNINSKKSDNLLPFDKYIDSFCSIQYKAFSYVCDKNVEHALEEYMNVLRLNNPFDYYKNTSRESFSLKLKQSVSPLYQIAENQGFQVVSSLF